MSLALSFDPTRIGGSRTSDSVVDYLRSLIFTGRLAPDDALPTERDLAEQLGVARLTLRVALKALETDGLLVIKVGSKGGPFVNGPEAIGWCWERWVGQHRESIAEALEFRRIVEEQVAAQAAECRTEQDLRTMEALLATPTRTPHAFGNWHYELELAIGRAAHNRFLLDAMMKAEEQLFFPAHLATEAGIPDMTRAVHARIVAAIGDRDPARAVAEMGAHLTYAEDLFFAAANLPVANADALVRAATNRTDSNRQERA